MLNRLFLVLLLAVTALPAGAEELPYLLTVASKGDVSTLQAMLASGVNPDTKDRDGITALMYAARKDRADAAKVLLDKGANVNAKDGGGWTPLMFAAKKNYVST